MTGRSLIYVGAMMLNVVALIAVALGRHNAAMIICGIGLAAALIESLTPDRTEKDKR